MEEYKEHPLYRGYKVSASGKVISPFGRSIKHRLSNRQAKSYSCLIKFNNKNLTVQVKTLVYETYMGTLLKPEQKLENIDGDETNNSFSNLRIIGSDKEWFSHPIFSEYSAAECGTIKGKSGLMVNPTLCNSSGYLRMCMKSEHNEPIPYLAHRFVVECIYGMIPDKLTVNHLNGIKTDNRISNLEVVTQAENNHHAKVFGLNQNYSETHYRSSLTKEDVIEIKAQLAKGVSVVEIHTNYSDKVSAWAIYRIKQGKNWKEIY